MSNIERLRVCLAENQYIVPSFKVYGGAKGFQDYGMLGVRVKNKLIDLWREFFLFENNIVEVETPIITPYDALKASGHVDKFTDPIVFDGDGNCYRADHLLENFADEHNMPELAQVSTWSVQQMSDAINKHGIIKGTYVEETKKYLPVEVKTKNLMFDVSSTNVNNKHGVDFLRPEVAIGMFLSFKGVQDFYKRDLPFGIAQAGRAYRREISPTPFTRMREFHQMEIEFFIDPKNPSYPKVKQYLDMEIPLLSSKDQLNGIKFPTTVTISSALTNGVINHETMAYFVGRMYDFAMSIGLKKDKVRFRQHLPDEMAHYANCCFDLECFVSDRWLECVGIADRGDWDLKAHSNGQTRLTCKRKLDVPVSRTILKTKLDMKSIGSKYREFAAKIKERFDNITQEELEQMNSDSSNVSISINDTQITIDRSYIQIEHQSIKEEFEEFYPYTIEPSIGIDRLLYAVFEHSFWVRSDDEQRIVLSLPGILLPYDVAVLPLHKKDDMMGMADSIRQNLRKHKIYCFEDSSNTTIGKRYSRLDEMGIRYAITVDPGSLTDQSVTIRERDSMKQIRVSIENVPETIISLINGTLVI
jgi:glycyl-tRNA synthetase